jgi:hypothetical protein
MRALHALAAFVVAAAAQAADPPARHVDELMRKSGLDTQIGQIPAQLKQGAAESREREKADPAARNRMTDAEYARLTAAMDRSFAAGRLRALVAASLAQSVSADDERAVLGFLSTDLGVRVTKLEEKSGEPREIAAAEREAPALWEKLAPERARLLRRLADSSDIGEAGAGLMIDMALAIAYGAAMTMPDADERAIEPMRRRFEAQRPLMAAAFRDHVLRNFAYTYRELPDDELARYAAFSESPAGRRFSQATIKALGSAFAQASLDLGRELGKGAAASDRRS